VEQFMMVRQIQLKLTVKRLGVALCSGSQGRSACI
jgi:hypothetical protein